MLCSRRRPIGARVVAEHEQRHAGSAQLLDRGDRARNRRVAEVEHAPGVEHHRIELIADLANPSHPLGPHRWRLRWEARFGAAILAPGMLEGDEGHLTLLGSASRLSSPAVAKRLGQYEISAC